MCRKRTIAALSAVTIGIALLLSYIFVKVEMRNAGKSAELSSNQKDNTEQKNEAYAAYIFVYFTGNNPGQEKIFFSVSEDGYNFKSLNRGRPVLSSKAGTKCTRDPFIFKGEDGFYYMLATDMKSSLGWNSNRNIVTWRSKNLVNWTNETLIEISGKFKSVMSADRVWAPQAIYDPEAKQYMIYWATRLASDPKGRTLLWYAYTRDFKKLATEPKLLFAPASGNNAIDGDIYYKDGTYYLYYKDETEKNIKIAASKHASGPYKQESGAVSPPGRAVEGSCIYKLINENKWVMISDAYEKGYYVMQETMDLVNFTQVQRSGYSFNFTPRHGYVIPITQKQYESLLKAYP